MADAGIIARDMVNQLMEGMLHLKFEGIHTIHIQREKTTVINLDEPETPVTAFCGIEKQVGQGYWRVAQPGQDWIELPLYQHIGNYQNKVCKQCLAHPDFALAVLANL